jgi:hypothetical protein
MTFSARRCGEKSHFSDMKNFHYRFFSSSPLAFVYFYYNLLVKAGYSRLCVSVCMRVCEMCEFFHYEAVLLINTFALWTLLMNFLLVSAIYITGRWFYPLLLFHEIKICFGQQKGVS